MDETNPQFGFAPGITTTADAGTPERVGSPEEIEAANMQIAVQQANEQIAADPGRFDINVDDDITSDVLQGQNTFEDVAAFRSEREAAETGATSLNDFDPNVTGVQAFDDPEQTIRSLLFDTELSQAEQQQRNILEDVSSTTAGTDEALTGARERAEDTTQISDRQSALAETNEKLARRQTRFRRELRAYEADAERRGVARTFFEQGRNKLEADAVAELADLSIIQQAQQGNVEAARNYINTAVDNRYKSIEIELKQKQAELDALQPTLNQEQKQEAQRLQIALNERERNLGIEREDAKEKRNLAIQAGTEGASPEIQRQIINGDIDNAFVLAGQWVGRLDRQIKQRQYQKLGIEIESAYKKAQQAANDAKNGTLTPDQYKIANDLRSEVNGLAEVKDAKNLEANAASLLAALNQENGVSDISAINTFQRLVVDPGVAVREGDVSLLQSAQSFTDEATLRARGLFVGDKLTPTARQQMKDLVSEVYRIRTELVDKNTQSVRTIANEQGIDYGKYIGQNFKTFEQIQAGITGESADFSVPTTDSYLDEAVSLIATDPMANPFGVSLE